MYLKPREDFPKYLVGIPELTAAQRTNEQISLEFRAMYKPGGLPRFGFYQEPETPGRFALIAGNPGVLTPNTLRQYSRGFAQFLVELGGPEFPTLTVPGLFFEPDNITVKLEMIEQIATRETRLKGSGPGIVCRQNAPVSEPVWAGAPFLLMRGLIL